MADGRLPRPDPGGGLDPSDQFRGHAGGEALALVAADPAANLRQMVLNGQMAVDCYFLPPRTARSSRWARIPVVVRRRPGPGRGR
jgi:hypothetical protein